MNQTLFVSDSQTLRQWNRIKHLAKYQIQVILNKLNTPGQDSLFLYVWPLVLVLKFPLTW